MSQERIVEFEGNPESFEETARLRTLMMWGSPGVEAVLAQLLPTRISCFESQFNVLGAREEFETAKDAIVHEGVQVIVLKDIMSSMVRDRRYTVTGDLRSLEAELVSLGRCYYQEYLAERTKDAKESSEKTGSEYEAPSGLEVLDWIRPILEEDAQKYGEATTISMVGKLITAGEPLPLANVMYARDQSDLLGRVWVWSSMKHAIRQPEVSLYRDIVEYAGIIDRQKGPAVQVCGSGRFEGGDGIPNNGEIYIGVGGRTNLEGVMQIAPAILAQGTRLFVPYDEARDCSKDKEMDAMHLDTIWMPFEKNGCVGCVDEIKRRRILEVVNTLNQGIKVVDRGWFMDHLEARKVDLIPLTKEEQLHYAPNFLNLGNGAVILSLSRSCNVAGELAKRGKTVYDADLVDITKGYGGLHCLTAAIRRG